MRWGGGPCRLDTLHATPDYIFTDNTVALSHSLNPVHPTDTLTKHLDMNNAAQLIGSEMRVCLNNSAGFIDYNRQLKGRWMMC